MFAIGMFPFLAGSRGGVSRAPAWSFAATRLAGAAVVAAGTGAFRLGADGMERGAYCPHVNPLDYLAVLQA
jgi:hypothetical protein